MTPLPNPEALGALRSAGVDEELAARLAVYAALVLDANRRLNLTGAKDGDAFAKHILDALTLRADVAGPLIDVGSGNGVPGIPLAIATGHRVVLLEPIKKRATFLVRTLAALGLDGEALNARAEDAARDPAFREQFSTATARAVSTAPVRCGAHGPVPRHPRPRAATARQPDGSGAKRRRRCRARPRRRARRRASRRRRAPHPGPRKASADQPAFPAQERRPREAPALPRLAVAASRDPRPPTAQSVSPSRLAAPPLNTGGLGSSPARSPAPAPPSPGRRFGRPRRPREVSSRARKDATSSTASPISIISVIIQPPSRSTPAHCAPHRYRDHLAPCFKEARPRRGRPTVFHGEHCPVMQSNVPRETFLHPAVARLHKSPG